MGPVVTAEIPPSFDSVEASALAKAHFGLELAAVTPLVSYDDQNLLGVGVDGRRYVLKMSNTRERPIQLEAQHAMLGHLARHAPDLTLPRPIANARGEEIVAVQSSKGHTHLFRILTFLEGRFLADVSTKSSALLRNFGAFVGRVTAALTDFQHPGAHRELVWDLRNVTALADDLDCIDDPDRRRLVAHYLLQIETHLSPALPSLRRSVIHNDPNDYNVLVDPETESQIVGLIDFAHIISKLQLTVLLSLISSEHLVRPVSPNGCARA